MSRPIKCVICGGPHTQREHFEQQRHESGVTNNQKEAVSTDQGVTNSVTNKDDKQAKQRARTAKWRAKHKEKYTSDMKEVMQKKRAAKAEYIKTHLEMMEDTT